MEMGVLRREKEKEKRRRNGIMLGLKRIEGVLTDYKRKNPNQNKNCRIGERNPKKKQAIKKRDRERENQSTNIEGSENQQWGVYMTIFFLWGLYEY